MKKVLFGFILVLFTVASPGTDIRGILPADPLAFADDPFDNLHTPWVDSVFNSLTPDQRIGQLFFVTAYSNLEAKHVDAITEYINKYRIGGLIFFQGGPKRQALLANRYQALSKTPLLIAMDAEWGLGMRLDSCVSFPRQMALGAIEDTILIYRMGVEIGLQCRRMGIHLNFAPVADLNNNPLNPVIGMRSFGEDSRDAAKRGVMYIAGLQRQHILTAAKHFPGHGNTAVDSHHALPVIAESYADLDSLEWYPYKEMMRNNLTGILAAHLHVPGLDSTPDLAASLSRRVLTDILRDSLHFNGLIYTDALNMKGVSKYFKPGELEVKALEAGADVLLMPTDIPKAMAAVRTAIDSGRISREQIELSCRRILAAKEWTGLNHYRPIDTTGLHASLNSPQADLLSRQLVEASLTVVQNRDSILPLKRLDKEKTAILITGASQTNNFLQTLNLYEENDYYFLDKNDAGQKENALFDKLKTYSRVIVGIHNTTSNPAKGYGILPNVAAFVDRLTGSTDVILCLFAPPYALSSFTKKDRMSAIVVSYQETPLAQDYTAQLVYGAIAGKGTLPVSVDSAYRYRQGIHTAGGLRLKYSIPEEVEALSCKLLPIDTMVRNAIKDHVMPGCQILAARNGIVFFRKEYGQIRYGDEAEPVDPRHIYDLASVSKIAATLPSVMLLHDRGQIRLRNRLVDYLPELKGSNKERITMIDVLTHQARLQPFIGFYLQTMEPLDSTKRLLASVASPLYAIRLGPGTYLNSRRRFKDGYYAASEDGKHRLQVADAMYVASSYRDTVFNGIRDSKLLAKKQYKYSDLGFIMLARVIERLGEMPLEEFTAQHFYNRLGATTLGYLPTERFPQGRMAPTANDTVFRRQWLQGHVHDENAAVMGGVSGHAGVFGTANDLAKLMQMYLNKGTYGGERYIREETIADFTSSPFARQGNRRGIGFDKPELSPRPNDLMGKYASKKSFGHTGFTGTMVWMDPENGLLYVFLSNRICPDAANNKLSTSHLRSRIYEVLANAMNVEK
ncbi:MAG: serine hydrolase [Bacteroidales bacterium]|jgi:beta-glucosidase-like glycosyl hydrolase/CubicO group peptidase (beta-lactamase class C family)|nr:serine hydrolase [Bacteroidales bacterium]